MKRMLQMKNLLVEVKPKKKKTKKEEAPLEPEQMEEEEEVVEGKYNVAPGTERV